MSKAPDSGRAAKPKELVVATDESGNVVATHSGGVTGPAEGVPAAAGMVARHGFRVRAVEMTPDLQRLQGEDLHAALREKGESLRDLPLPEVPYVDLPDVGLKGRAGKSGGTKPKRST